MAELSRGTGFDIVKVRFGRAGNRYVGGAYCWVYYVKNGEKKGVSLKPLSWDAEAPPVFDNNRCKAGNPISISNGEKIQRENIFRVQGSPLLNMYLTYSSISRKWRTGYEKKLTVDLGWDSENKIWTMPKGWADGEMRPIEWYENSAGYAGEGSSIRIYRGKNIAYIFQLYSEKWIEINGQPVRLDHVYDASGKVIAWKLSVYGTSEIYDLTGRLIEVSNLKGDKISLTYNESNTLVSDNKGKVVGMYYNKNHQLEKVTDPQGNDYVITYQERGLVESISYPDTTPENNLDNSKTTLLYESEYGLLTGIIDKNGIRYQTWEYDENSRGVLSKHGVDMDMTVLEFGDSGAGSSHTVVTNALKKNTVYHYKIIDNRKLLVKVEGVATDNCSAANQYMTYYSNGSVQTKTDWNGGVTYYLRDEYGREVLKREGLVWITSPQFGVVDDVLASLRSSNVVDTRTCWSSAHNLPKKIITDEYVEEFIYLPDGKLKSKNRVAYSEVNATCP